MSDLEKAFDSDMSGKKRNLRVYLINPPIQDPWRTRGDYILEQKRETTRFFMTIITLIIAVISICLTTYTAISTIQGI